MSKDWVRAQEWEISWWDDCVNTLHEEEKQMVYARKMGLPIVRTPKTPYNIQLDGQSVMDIGSGPSSLLLKCRGFGDAFAVDPLMGNYPNWVLERYSSIGINVMIRKGEEVKSPEVDEVWIYNVLEHTDDPSMIIENALAISKVVRLFEWVETSQNEGHPHSLSSGWLDETLGGDGKVEELSEHGCYGLAYYGVFKGKRYE